LHVIDASLINELVDAEMSPVRFLYDKFSYLFHALSDRNWPSFQLSALFFVFLFLVLWLKFNGFSFIFSDRWNGSACDCICVRHQLCIRHGHWRETNVSSEFNRLLCFTALVTKLILCRASWQFLYLLVRRITRVVEYAFVNWVKLVIILAWLKVCACIIKVLARSIYNTGWFSLLRMLLFDQVAGGVSRIRPAYLLHFVFECIRRFICYGCRTEVSSCWPHAKRGRN